MRLRSCAAPASRARRPPGSARLLPGLPQDLLTRLVVEALDGSTASVAGLFQPAQRTRAGCQCSQLWPYTWPNGSTTLVPGTCINPTNAQG